MCMGELRQDFQSWVAPIDCVWIHLNIHLSPNIIESNCHNRRFAGVKYLHAEHTQTLASLRLPVEGFFNFFILPYMTVSSNAGWIGQSVTQHRACPHLCGRSRHCYPLQDITPMSLYDHFLHIDMDVQWTDVSVGAHDDSYWLNDDFMTTLTGSMTLTDSMMTLTDFMTTHTGSMMTLTGSMTTLISSMMALAGSVMTLVCQRSKTCHMTAKQQYLREGYG